MRFGFDEVIYELQGRRKLAEISVQCLGQFGIHGFDNVRLG